MMRVGTALALLLGLSGCVSSHGDADTSSPTARDEALGSAAGSGGSRGEPKPVKGDCDVAPTPGKPPPPVDAPANGGQPGTVGGHQCELDVKLCYEKAENPADCDVIRKKCSSAPGDVPPTPANADCVIKVKECYGTQKDPAVCDEIRKFCPPPPEPTPAHSVEEACWLKVKDCYANANDPALCDEVRKKCEELTVAPPVPATAPAQPANDAYLACQLKAKECYGYEPDTTICDEVRLSCEDLLKVEPK